VKPKDQKEVNGNDTANGLPIQDRNDEGETNGPRRFGVDGGIQSLNWAERADGSISSGSGEQSGF
jgi:hypothetical protein